VPASRAPTPSGKSPATRPATPGRPMSGVPSASSPTVSSRGVRPARRLIEEVLNQGDLAVASELMSPTCIHHVPAASSRQALRASVTGCPVLIASSQTSTPSWMTGSPQVTRWRSGSPLTHPGVLRQRRRRRLPGRRHPPRFRPAGMSDRLAAHGGTLAVTSQPGQGTTITGCLPARSGSSSGSSSGGRDRADHVQPGGAPGGPDPGQDAGDRAQDQEQDQLQRRRREHGQRSAAG
jgi:hypothetical protein